MVFLCEDDPDIRELTSLALSFGGYEVHAFASGEEILNAAQGHTPDLFILDWHIPV